MDLPNGRDLGFHGAVRCGLRGDLPQEFYGFFAHSAYIRNEVVRYPPCWRWKLDVGAMRVFVEVLFYADDLSPVEGPERAFIFGVKQGGN